MSMIDRYRKKGGFQQLLNLIETTGKDKQEKFLKIIADESPLWESEVRKRLLTVDKILSWNPTYLAEIFPRIQAIQLAMVVGGMPPEKAEAFMKVMTFKEKRAIEELLKEKVPTPGETSAGIMKLYSEIRKMEAEGSLRFDKFDPDMVVPEDIEEKLGKGVGSVGLFPPSKEVEQALSQMAPPPVGTSPQLAEELNTLRRKLVQLSQENQKLHQDNSTMKEKLEQIKKIA
jgi:hypothetical protein